MCPPLRWTSPGFQLTSRDYRPELERLKADKEAKAEAAKQGHLERMLKDMGVKDAKGKNPFGPHVRNDRADALFDDEGGDADDDLDPEEREKMRHDMEAAEEAEHHMTLGAGDVVQDDIIGVDASGQQP